jgi:DNA recombination protein RmuC
MDTLQTILIIAGFAVILYLLLFRQEKQEPESLLLMQEQMKELRQTLNSQQGDMQKQIQNQFSQSTQIVKDVTERLTKLDETNKQVMGFAEQLQSL